MTPIDPNDVTSIRHVATATGLSVAVVGKWMRLAILPSHVVPTAKTTQLSNGQKSPKRWIVVRDLIAFCKGRNIPLDLAKLKVQRANRNSGNNHSTRAVGRFQKNPRTEDRGSPG